MLSGLVNFGLSVLAQGLGAGVGGSQCKIAAAPMGPQMVVVMDALLEPTQFRHA